MNDLEYKKQILDTKSASFCGAKWYNATIWLGSGMTTSCHHPLPHKIDLEAIKTNPSAIHNTVQKKEERRQMQCLSLIHISEPTRRTPISYAVFCLKKN